MNRLVTTTTKTRDVRFLCHTFQTLPEEHLLSGNYPYYKYTIPDKVWTTVVERGYQPLEITPEHGRKSGLMSHYLRHTFTSLMLLRGAKPKVISEASGHASVGFTMDVYSHIIEGMQKGAMALPDGALQQR